MTKIRMSDRMENVPIKDIRPYKRNPRKNDEAVPKVAESILKFGFRNPIILDKENVVIAGHTRLLAAKKLGLKEVPCIWADDLTPDEVKALRIVDNKTAEYAEWELDLLKEELDGINLDLSAFDFDIDLTGIDGSEPIEVQEDDFDEETETNDHGVKYGDIWQLGRHRLMCGDATKGGDILQLTDKESIDMVLTDPPYGMKLDGTFGGMAHNPKAIYKVVKDYENVIGDHEDFKPELITTLFNNLDAKEMFVFGADYFSELIPKKNDGSWLVWDKRATLQDLEWTTSEFELCWSKVKHHREVLRHTWHGLVGLSSEDTKSRVHPTQKPVSLLAEIISKWGDKTKSIADLYGGSGSTLIACEQTDRQCYMMELDPHYCDVIISRWEKLTGQKAVKVC